MASTDLLELVQKLEAMIMKVSDGSIDPGDVEFIDEQLERVREWLSQGLDSIVDGQQDNFEIALLVLGLIKSYLIIMAMRGK